jgi:hypothetical protein
MSDLFSSLLIFTIIKTILSTFFFTVSKFYKNLVKWALTEILCSVAGTTTVDRECCIVCPSAYHICLPLLVFSNFSEICCWEKQEVRKGCSLVQNESSYHNDVSNESSYHNDVSCQIHVKYSQSWCPREIVFITHPAKCWLLLNIFPIYANVYLVKFKW